MSLPGKQIRRDLEAGLKRARALVQRHARVGGCHPNPDEVVVANVVEGLARNWCRYGRLYCPCREVSGVPEKDRGNICPCATHKEDIARDGVCECGLFVSYAHLKAQAAE